MAVINCTVTKSSWYRMYIEYSISTNVANRQSTITHALKLEQLTNSYDFKGNMNVTYYIAGNAFSFNDTVDIDDKGDAGYTITIKQGTTVINHNATTGDASFTVSCSGSCNSGGWGPGTISLSETTVSIERIPIYTLTITAGSNSSITVNRTASGGNGSTGNLTAGTNKLYYGDKLKITFTPSTNYSIATHTVNGTSFSSGSTHTVSGNVTVVSSASPVALYTLTVSATNSTVTVNRTSSPSGSTGNISSGAKLYNGDILRITFTPNTNYEITTHTVNGSTFTSGNTHTVSSNVSVVSTATALASKVGATNADIGSNSTITVTKYNSSYYHSLQYSFGSLSGYIKSDGTTQSSSVKFSQTSVSFAVPATFYAQIPNAKTGTCTITCRTYSSSSSSTVLGTTTCTFKVTAASRPTVSGTVIDSNATTVALTGDNTKLIRYRSTAQCTITPTAGTSATVTSATINDVVPTNNQCTFTEVSATSFVFNVKDSRSYTASYTVNPNIINYVMLTCNPVLTRTTPTSDTIQMRLSGDLYQASFGSYSNTLTLRYRYREVGGTYGSWTTISSGIVYVPQSNAYGTAVDSPITLGTNFDYQKGYEFQVEARDGANNYVLTSVTKTVIVQQGIPIFDWGKDDFCINVPLKAQLKSSFEGESGFYIEHGLAHEEANFTATRSDTGTSVYMGVGSGGINHGVYSNTLGKWIVYADASDVYCNGTATNVTGVVGIDHGGTNATTAAAARTNLGIGVGAYNVGGLVTSGFVTSSSTSVRFSIPCFASRDGMTASLSSCDLLLRQGGNYTHGSSSTVYATPDSVSLTARDGFVIVYATFSDTTNAVNNDAIGVMMRSSVTLTLS